MSTQLTLFTNTAQIPPTGLTTEKEQAIDPLEGLRRKEEAREEAQDTFKAPMPGEIWKSKETGLEVEISHSTPGLIWYNMPEYNRPQATGAYLFLEKMKRS